MTYMLGGQQYIVLAISGQDFPGELIAFRLPDERRGGLQAAVKRGRVGGVGRVAESGSASSASGARGASLIGRAQGPERFSGPSSQSMLQIFDEYWEWKIARRPELATQAGRREHNARWTDRSRAARDKELYDLREWLQKAMYFSPGTLTPAMRLSAFLLEADVRDQIESEPYLDAISLVSQADGVHNRVLTTIDQMPASTVLDYENIVARIRALPSYVDQAIAQIQEHVDAGLTQPAMVVDLMLEQLAAQRSAPPQESPLLAAFQRFPDAIPASGPTAPARGCGGGLYAPVPAVVDAPRDLPSRHVPAARASAGRHRLGAGRADGIRAADQALHHDGDGARADSSGRAHARWSGSSARCRRSPATTASRAPSPHSSSELANRPGMHFESQDEMLAYAEDVLASVQPRLPALFASLPRMKVGIRPIPPDREASHGLELHRGHGGRIASGVVQHEHLPAARAGRSTRSKRSCCTSRSPAIICSRRSRARRLAFQRSSAPSTPRRSARAGRCMRKGWARNWVSIAIPPTRFGRLASEYFRAVRLVVDTGIHSMGWTRDQARAYFSTHVPSQSIAEVDRYIARPGQALALQAGAAQDPRAARPGTGRARRTLRPQGVPRRGAAERAPAAGPARRRGRYVHRQARGADRRALISVITGTQ